MKVIIVALSWMAHNAGPTAVVAANDMTTLTMATPAIVLTKTVGTDSATCASTDEIAVPTGTDVIYCYEVENTGDVVDSPDPHARGHRRGRVFCHSVPLRFAISILRVEWAQARP